MRERAERAVATAMSPDRAALMRGMVLGEDDQIADATRDDWRDAGLAHLLAVSGQNVMLLAALALPVLMLARAGLRARLIALAVLIAVYVPLAGAGPSLQRAGIMGLAGIAAMAASRPASRWYALLLAATATLLWNPRAWADPGWQLSFAAVAGILILGVPLQRALRRVVRELTAERERPAWPVEPGPPGPPRQPPAALRDRAARLHAPLLGALADGVAITVAATLATAPLLAHHFGYIPLAGLPANLAALPAVAPAMWLGMVQTALGQLSAPFVPGPIAGVASAAAGVTGTVASIPIGYLAAVAERFADMPGGRLSRPAPIRRRRARPPTPRSAWPPSPSIGAPRELGDRLPEWAFAWRGLPRSRRRPLAGAR